MGWLVTVKKDPPAVVALNSMLKGKDLNQETRIAIDSLKQKVLADPEKYGADVNDLIPLLHDVRVREAAMRSLASVESDLAALTAKKEKIEKEEDVKSKIKLAAQRVLAGLSPEPEPEPVPMQPLDLAAANGATVVQAQKNGATLVTEVISDEQRAEELAEKLAREELIVTLKAQVEDGVEIKLQATRLFCSMIADVEESSRKEATAQQKRLHELEAALEKSGAPQDAPLVGAVKNKSYEAPNLENNQVRVPRKAGESKHDYLVRKFGVMQDDRVAFKAAKAAKLASMNSEIASLNHQAYDARAADLNAERTKAGVVAAKAKRVHIQDPKTKKWKRKSSCEKADAPDVTEDVGVEEEKGGEPAPPSPPPRAPLQDHNDNEETKAKVKKTPAKKGYVSARVKKIEGKE